VQGINAVTISQGKIVWRDGELRTEKGAGRYINRPPFPAYYTALLQKAELERPRPVLRDAAAE